MQQQQAANCCSGLEDCVVAAHVEHPLDVNTTTAVRWTGFFAAAD
jgi:hypothetical protein